MQLVFDINRLENLKSLYEHEEKLRTQSLKVIESDPVLSEQLFLVSNAMNAFFAYCHEHVAKGDDERTVQYFAIRLFNSTGVSIKLALGGYVQQALGQIRDVVEVAFLLDYFCTSPEQIQFWRDSDKRTRLSKYSPKHIREALDERDGSREGKRKAVYDLLCEYSTHATYHGFTMTNKDGGGLLGPFVDEIKLRAWLQEITLRVLPAAQMIVQLIPNVDVEVSKMGEAYRELVEDWWRKQRAKSEKSPVF